MAGSRGAMEVVCTDKTLTLTEDKVQKSQVLNAFLETTTSYPYLISCSVPFTSQIIENTLTHSGEEYLECLRCADFLDCKEATWYFASLLSPSRVPEFLYEYVAAATFDLNGLLSDERVLRTAIDYKRVHLACYYAKPGVPENYLVALCVSKGYTWAIDLWLEQSTLPPSQKVLCAVLEQCYLSADVELITRLKKLLLNDCNARLFPFALRSGRLDLVKSMLDKLHSREIYPSTVALKVVTLLGFTDIVCYLLEVHHLHYGNFSWDVIASNSLEFIEHMLARKDFGLCKNLALAIAAYQENSRIISHLLDFGADVSSALLMISNTATSEYLKSYTQSN